MTGNILLMSIATTLVYQICKGKRGHDISGIKMNGESMLHDLMVVMPLLGELFPRCEPSAYLGYRTGRGSGGKKSSSAVLRDRLE